MKIEDEYIDEYFCDHCDAETEHKVEVRIANDRQDDSIFTCLVCKYYRIGWGEQQEPYD